MKTLLRGALAVAIALSACLPMPADAAPPAQIPVVSADGSSRVPSQSIAETYVVVSGNVSAGTITLMGGDYILDQVCTAYGTLTLQRLGPDGSTFITSVAKSASDTATGTGVTFGNGAQVKVVLSGTTGCNATLSRVP